MDPEERKMAKSVSKMMKVVMERLNDKPDQKEEMVDQDHDRGILWDRRA